MTRPGWIKLYNQTLDNELWVDLDEPFDWRSAFIHVLLSANWRDGVSRRNGHEILIKRGQMLTSIRKLMATFHWSRKRVEHWLKGMDARKMLTAESVGFGTVLTVVNYNVYQSEGATEEHTGEHTAEHTAEHTGGHAEEHTAEPRSKTIDIRQQTEDSKSASAEPPPAEGIGPPIGSREWYALHNDD